jgi:hypothetical protein
MMETIIPGIAFPEHPSKSVMHSATRHTKPSNPNFKQDHCNANEIIEEYWNECSSGTGILIPNDYLQLGQGRSYEKLAASPFQISKSCGKLCINGRSQQNRLKHRAPSPSSDVNTEPFIEGGISHSIVPNFAAANRAQARSTRSYERLISRCGPCVGMLNPSIHPPL